MEQIRLLACVVLTVAVLPLPASAWNIPGHMLSAPSLTRSFSRNPQTIDKVKAVLEKHPWYANQWQARLQDVPAADRDQVLFMQAARWPDDIRIKDNNITVTPLALHQLALQTRWTTGEPANQRT